MSHTTRNTPRPLRPPIPSLPVDSPSLTVPRFALFLQQLGLPLGRLRAHLAALHQSLGEHPLPETRQTLRLINHACHILDAGLEEVRYLLDDSAQLMNKLLAMLDRTEVEGLEDYDLYIPLKYLQGVLDQARNELKLA
ncbi:hypothetical protein [uncultured Aquitalea sp.]|uniref:hypothetical protein n=1 Tax=uncultured Aquitalea sp. TaxID=540272 RepID=UPI0025F69BDF|nr:hypothetical protein [uncultured Aquitalea sp.]